MFSSTALGHCDIVNIQCPSLSAKLFKGEVMKRTTICMWEGRCQFPLPYFLHCLQLSLNREQNFQFKHSIVYLFIFNNYVQCRLLNICGKRNLHNYKSANSYKSPNLKQFTMLLIIFFLNQSTIVDLRSISLSNVQWSYRVYYSALRGRTVPTIRCLMPSPLALERWKGC